jgi:hypothetical protein
MIVVNSHPRSAARRTSTPGSQLVDQPMLVDVALPSMTAPEGSARR